MICEMQFLLSSKSAVSNSSRKGLLSVGKCLPSADQLRTLIAIAAALLCCTGLAPLVDAQPPLPSGQPADLDGTKVMADINWPADGQQLTPPSNLDLSQTNPLLAKPLSPNHLSRLNSARRQPDQAGQPESSGSLQPAANDPTFLALFQADGDSAEIAESRLSELLKKLRQSRLLRDGGSFATDATGAETTADSGASDLADSSTRSIDDTFVDPVDTQASVNEIRERIRMIRRWRDQMSARIGSENRQGISPPLMERGPLDNGGNEQQALLRRSITNPQGPGGNDIAIEMSDAKQEQHVSATQMLDGPVDHLALGESLYQTGSYETALLSLSQLDSRQLAPEDSTWVGFMVAMCHYRTGNNGKAESLLREIVNTKSSDPMLATAQWWLEHVQETSDAKAQMQQATVLMERLNPTDANAN
ncbi:MAG: hypothetical protein CBB71_06210 [Rhodopirellula sp. TMED11]|nr:MAG: hypothetical protein CBB71_06210 [Rhodopirellula sp. TMED11]